MTRRGWTLFLALALIWGIPYLLIKVAVRELSPASLVFLRTALGAALLLPAAISRGGLRALLPRWRPVVASTVAELVVPWFLLADVERRVPSALAGLSVASVPTVGALFALASGARERIGLRRAAGMAAGVAGVAALLGLDLGGADPLAWLELLVVVAGYAWAPQVVARELADVPALDVVTASVALTALVYAPAGVAGLVAAPPGTDALLAVAALGAVCTALAFLLFFRLIAEVGPLKATLITYLNPAVAVLAGVAFLGERVTAGTAAGFVLILAGTWLATSKQRATPGTRPGTSAPLAAPSPARPAARAAG
ncbi:MAG: DMT family transporter [Anaeromyxobacter sp.]